MPHLLVLDSTGSARHRVHYAAFCSGFDLARRSLFKMLHEGSSENWNVSGNAGESALKLALARTFLELGDATSCNLEFSHRDDVRVSYGEETITETNLLEIRRRHPGIVRVYTFPKRVEATNGADWEWHIVGSRWTLRMRVQAKRIRRNGVLAIKRKVKSSGKNQRSFLLAGAKADGVKPVYCIYCTEPQRKTWKKGQANPGFRSFETGCLLVGADDVPDTTTRLCKIEKKCRPWHHLFAPDVLMQERERLETVLIDRGGEGFMRLLPARQPRVFLFLVGVVERMEGSTGSRWNAPTIEDLNGDTEQEFDRTGVRETTGEDLASLELDTSVGPGMAWFDEKRLREPGIRRMLVMDVRGDREPDKRSGRRGN